MPPRGRTGWIAAGLALALALPSCAGTLDVERMRRAVQRPRQPRLPAFQAEVAEDLPSPEGLHARSGELRAVPLQWDPLLGGNIGGYAVERAAKRDGSFRRVAALAGRATTVYVDTGEDASSDASPGAAEAALADGVTRFYRVRAFTRDGRLAAAASAVVEATTAPPPNPPGELRAYSMQPRQVPLSWRASEDPQVGGYVVERGPSSSGPFDPVGRVEGRHTAAYLDRELGDLRVFYYRVRSMNRAGGIGEPSEPVRAVTKPEPLPPLDLRVSARRLGENLLEWKPNVETDLAEYRLLRIRGNAKAPELVAVLPRDTTRAADTGVGAGERLAYTMVARDRDGLESAAAEPIEVESEGYELDASVAADGIRLGWNPRTKEGFVGARIFAGGLAGQSEVAVVKGSTYVHRETQPGKRYRFTVVLVRPDGTQAPPSPAVEVVVPAD